MVACAGTALTAAGGCASMHGREKIHVVRTDPEGRRVVDEFGRTLGTSPLYVALPRARTLRLGIAVSQAPPPDTASDTSGAKTAERKSIRWFEMECSYRWLASGVLNVPGVGQGFDLLTGAAWDCPANISLRTKASAADPASTNDRQDVRRCGRFLAVVPRHFTAWETERLSKEWLALPRLDAKACDRFAAAAEGEALLERYGLTHSTRLEQWDDWRLRQIAGTLDLTHVVFFEPSRTSGATGSYTTRRYDVFPKPGKPGAGAETRHFLPSAKLDVPPARAPSFYSWRQLQRIVPNALVGGWGAETSTWSLRETGVDYVTSNPRNLFFRTMDFDWREKYRPWDWSYRIFSTDFGLFYGRDRVRAEEKYRSDGRSSGEAPTDALEGRRRVPALDVQRLSISTHFLGSITGHAPLASLYLSAGFGPVYSRLSGDHGVASKLIPLSFLYRVGLLVPMGPDWLLTSELSAATMRQTYGPWKLSDIVGSRVGLGYLFPSPPTL